MGGLIHNRRVIRPLSVQKKLICRVTEWTKAPIALRKSHIELLLESLEHRDAEIRFTNARRLFYVLQGNLRCRNDCVRSYRLHRNVFGNSFA